MLCRAMREEGGFNGAGVMQQHTFLLGLLKNRLLIEDLLRRHPEILEERIAAPIIICGLPRTGTTHLHNLMSADPALRSLPYWESLEPVLAERERPAPGAPDPRLERTAMALSFLDAALPYFKRMHEMTVEHTHEEIQLLAIDFSTMLFETTAPMPIWRDDYLARDQRPSYAYLRKDPPGAPVAAGRHAVGPQVPPAPRAVPRAGRDVPRRHLRRHPPRPGVGHGVDGDDARLLGPAHPRPRRPRGHRPLLGGPARAHAAPLRRPNIDVLPADQTIDVHFDEFMADDMAMVGRVYELAGQPLDARSRAAMTAFMAEHPRGRFGAVEYDLAAVRPGPRRAPKGPLVLHRSLRRDLRVVGLSPRPASDQRMAERRMRPQRRATCTHRYPSSTSADATCHPMSRNGIPTSRGWRITWLPESQVVGPRDEHVEGQQGQHQVRPRQPATAAEPRAGRPRFPSNRATVWRRCTTCTTDQGHERQPDDQVRPPLRDQRHGRQRGGEGRQQARGGPRNGPASGGPGPPHRPLTARGARSSPTRRRCGRSRSPTPSAGWRSPSGPVRPAASR